MPDSTAHDLHQRRRPRGDRQSPNLMDRLPPHSPEAEQGLLGCCVHFPTEAIPIAASDLTGGSEAFYDLRNGSICTTLFSMWDSRRVIDTVTLVQELRDKQLLEQVGGVAYIASLEAAPAFLASEYARIVREKYMLRRAIHTCTDLVGRIYDSQTDPETTLDLVEKEIIAIRQQDRRSNVKTAKEMMVRAISKIEDMNDHRGTMTGLSTGFTDLDKLTGGLQDGDMIVIAARPSMGKTSLAMNIAEHVAVNLHLPVGVFSLEMTYEQLGLRMLCSRARVNLRNVREGFLAERDFPKLTGAAGKIGSSFLFVDDTSGISVMQFRARARAMFQQHEIKMFVVDYLQLMHSTSKRAERREQEIADISSGIKNLAKELKVPIIVLSQLNREIEKEKRRPRLSDLRESGAIEQDSDVVGMLYKPQSKDDDDAGRADDAIAVNLLIAKQRNGPADEDVPLTFLKNYTRFESAARVSDADLPDDSQREFGERTPHND